MRRQRRIGSRPGGGGELGADAGIDIASGLDIGAELIGRLHRLGTGLDPTDGRRRLGTGQQPSSHGEHRQRDAQLDAAD
ncbi:MAG: hypothetical protein HIU85_11030 [Proteobacteria bacterium]|nr:hypothetical protein [Pseudomonadota bacterium]